MKNVIRWAISNSPAMNTFLICTLAVGAVSLIIMRREVFPNFDLEIALVSVPYPGSSPDEVETGICQVIEEAVSGIDGIKKTTSVAQEGFGYVILELERDANVQKAVQDIRDDVSNVRRKFPENIEEPEISTISFKTTAIRLALMAPEGIEDRLSKDEIEIQLRDQAEKIRDELLLLQAAPAENWLRQLFSPLIVPAGRPAISTVQISGAKPYQITVEIPEANLRKFGLTLEQVARIVGDENAELPAGKLKSASQEILVKGDNKRRDGEGIGELVILNRDTGDNVKLNEIANVIDGFDDASLLHYVNGRPALVINVNRATNEDLFTVVNTVQKYLEDKTLSDGYQLHVWGDMSIDVRDRIDLLMRNGLQGLILVFLVLALFLELRLAFWVAMGIPVAMLGAGICLLYGDQTLNMLTMFSFLMALGIVVDDAIVIGENIYAKREAGMGMAKAAVEGTVEVVPSVAASIATTVIAFVPLMYVSGVMGKFIAVMPLAVIAMLLISLVESVFVLPCHLAHKKNLFISFLETILYVFWPLAWLMEKARVACDAGVKWFIEHIYASALRWCLDFPLISMSSAGAVLILMVGFVAGGFVPFTGFPNLDSQIVEATIAFPDGSSETFARNAAARIEKGLNEAVAELEANGSGKMVRTVYRRLGEAGNDLRGPTGISSGSHVGNVLVELTPVGERKKTSQELIKLWREKVGRIAGVDVLKFGAQGFGPPGEDLEFKLLCKSEHADLLEKYAQRCKDKLGQYQGVYDIEDDMRPGKQEYRFRVNEVGKSMGVSQTDVYSAIRGAYYGVEVQRMQVGRNEVKLLVRLPEQERQNFSSFDELMVADGQQNKRPLTEIAEQELVQSPSEINRLNRLRSITISAAVDPTMPGLASKVTDDLKNGVKQQPQVSFWEVYKKAGFAEAWKQSFQAQAPAAGQLDRGFLDQLQEDFREETGGDPLVVDWEGAQQQNAESFTSMFVGLMIALLAMYALLTMQFQSYVQPAIIMGIIPFGFVGAVLGHGLLGLELTLFSMFGLVALTGVIVNDSIVLVDFMNRYVREGGDLQEAVVEAGKRRFRAVMLTSMTTVAGLVPMLLETSFQAQVLIPMAASLTFGLIVGTVLILLLVPVFYRALAGLIHVIGFGEEYAAETSQAAETSHAAAKTQTLPIAASNSVPAETGTTVG